MTRHVFLFPLTLALTILMAAPGASANPATVAGDAGTSTPIASWRMQWSAHAQEAGSVISQSTFQPTNWDTVSARSTVLAGLLENGEYPHILEKDHLKTVNYLHFDVPWWYRATFKLGTDPNLHTAVRLKGIIPRADVWLNGKKIADHTTVDGAYTITTLDVTTAVHAGDNTLAIKVYPANPNRDLAISWIDWNQPPPDQNMGIWRDVDIIRTGAVALRGTHVVSDLDVPSLASATLMVKTTAVNLTAQTQQAKLVGHIGDISFSRTIDLKPGETRQISFTPKTTPSLRLAHPRVWWPLGMGTHPLYQLSLKADVDGKLSDVAQVHFGIRKITSHLTHAGYRQFVVNGEPLMIRGGGYTPDLFLRDDPARLKEVFANVRNLGLNTIRLEGRLARQDLYDLADRTGVLVLAGWECCSKWEAAAKTGGQPWDAHDYVVARRSMTSEAHLLRNHPSVLGFLIGSDNAPPARLAKLYTDALKQADWPNPVIAAAATDSTAETGPSGMKMSGPYGWVPPDYWYGTKAGAAFGFNAETSAGASIPTVGTLKRILTPTAQNALWRCEGCLQYHSGPGWSPFGNIGLFNHALAKRYGKPMSLADYAAKAQLANYANVRAQFEAYNARMNATEYRGTGVVYWLLNSAWPSVHWHLFTFGQAPAGAYYGAQEANRPLHVQIDPTTGSVSLVNHSAKPARGMKVTIRVRDRQGKVVYTHELADEAIAANRARTIFTLPANASPKALHFVELTLSQDGHATDRNVYWLPAKNDVIDWAKSNWYTAPVTQFADLTALNQLSQVKVALTANTRTRDGVATTTVTIKNPAHTYSVALLTHLALANAAGKPIPSVTWSRNDVTLFAGQAITLTAHYPATGSDHAVVSATGWHTSATSIPANIP